MADIISMKDKEEERAHKAMLDRCGGDEEEVKMFLQFLRDNYGEEIRKWSEERRRRLKKCETLNP